jgi:hypothetical protein
MRALTTTAFLCFAVSFALPAVAQQPTNLATSQLTVESSTISPQDGVSAFTSDRLEFEWGLDVATGQKGLGDFTGYAMDWSSFRLADGRILSFAYQYGGGIGGPNAIRHGRLAEGVPSSTPVDQARVFRAPRTWPQIEGYTFLDGFRAESSGPLRFVGLWKNEASQERMLVAFDDPSSTSGYEILGQTELDADVVSASEPLHGGSTRISVATSPDPDGSFRIMTFRWRQGS